MLKQGVYLCLRKQIFKFLRDFPLSKILSWIWLYWILFLFLTKHQDQFLQNYHFCTWQGIISVWLRNNTERFFHWLERIGTIQGTCNSTRQWRILGRCALSWFIQGACNVWINMSCNSSEQCCCGENILPCHISQNESKKPHGATSSGCYCQDKSKS